MNSDKISPEIHHREDNILVNEEFELDGEPVERQTKIYFNDDGSVTIAQSDQTNEVVTLSEGVMNSLQNRLEAQE